MFLNIPNADYLSDKVYVQGYFEDFNYFSHLRTDLIKMFKPLNKFIQNNSELINMLKNTNSVSIHIRQHRYTEQEHKKYNLSKKKKNYNFFLNLIEYIKISIKYI